MNAETGRIVGVEPWENCANAHLLRAGTGALQGLADETAELSAAILGLEKVSDDATREILRRLRRQLAGIETSVTLIGQVKAGKTALANAMMAAPGLLPSDVNPWTSVVTSVHLTPRPPAARHRASFRFFERDEWERLLERGGRLGELAARAGAGDEVDKLRVQIGRLLEKSRSRLGRRFELLMGQRHDYGAFDADMIERYVCLGDPDDEEAGAQGRFADITRSADLILERPQIPAPVCLRDTPGVNDTFMMREQVTLRAIRESRLCVVVLAAHQALSTVDLAVLRMIANVRSRDVVIFVNRIDELSDPRAQIPEIRDSVAETLRIHGGPEDAAILFGSALWANAALTGDLAGLPGESRAALAEWAEHAARPEDGGSALDAVWELGGVPALYRAIGDRAAQGQAGEALGRVARSAGNVARTMLAANGRAEAVESLPRRAQIGPLVRALDRIEAESAARLEAELRQAAEQFRTRLDRAHGSFLQRATEALVAHLETSGENATWTYDPGGLRLLLRSAHRVYEARGHGAANRVLGGCAEAVTAAYAAAFGPGGPQAAFSAPESARLPPPVTIGQTIALDLPGTWWRRWWNRRRGYGRLAPELHRLIAAETEPLVAELHAAQTAEMRRLSLDALHAFIEEQRDLLAGMVREDGSLRPDMGAERAARRRRAEAAAALMRYCEGRPPAALEEDRT